jgi:TatD DNase family protein
MTGLIDSHAHLTSGGLLEQVGAVVDRAVAAGVERVISIAVDMADAERVLELSDAFEAVSAGAGFHPHEAGKLTADDWERFGAVVRDDRLVAIGEMGLDYHYDFADRAVQVAVLERQLAFAIDIDKPIVIHSRDAHADTVSVLNRAGFSGRRVVFHCFTGTRAEAGEIHSHGWRTSFTGVVTFKNAGACRDVAVNCPIEDLMVETDSPYLSPVPVRNVRPNEPAHVVHIARFLAEQRGVPFDEFAAITNSNTRTFYGI